MRGLARHTTGVALGGIMALAAGTLCAQEPVLPTPPSPGIAADHVVIKFREDKVKEKLKSWTNVSLHRVQSLLDVPPGAELQETGYAEWKKEKRSREADRDRSDTGAALSDFMYLKLPPGLTPEQCVQRLKGNPVIEYVEVDPIGEGGAVVYPSDPDYNPLQWPLIDWAGWDNIHMPEAWGITTGLSSVVVAVLDTGCDTGIQEFAGRLVPGTNCLPGGGSVQDDHGHGTMVAGVLCANANNNTNIAGVDWCCKLMPIKVLDSSNQGPYAAWADGINWAVDNGANVINLSAGGTNAIGTALSDAISRAVSNGAIFVTITHNYGTNAVTVPGTHPGAITVGATTNNGRLWSGSSYGTNLALVAPGVNIRSVGRGGASTNGTGTSFAAPHVAGVAALILSIRPGLNSRQVRDLLCAGADDQVSGDPRDTPGRDNYYGWGRLNAYHSLLLARTEIGDLMATNSGDRALLWHCPTNASVKQPFRVNYATALTGAWTTVSNVASVGSNAVWVDTNAAFATSRFYRVTIKEHQPAPGN